MATLIHRNLMILILKIFNNLEAETLKMTKYDVNIITDIVSNYLKELKLDEGLPCEALNTRVNLHMGHIYRFGVTKHAETHSVSFEC